MTSPADTAVQTVLRNKKLTQDFWVNVLNGAQYDQIEKTLAPTYQYNGHHTSATGTASWLKFLHTSAPDLYFHIESISGSNDTTIIRWTLTATTQGKSAMLTGENVLVWNADGQCTSNWQSMGDPSFAHIFS